MSPNAPPIPLPPIVEPYLAAITRRLRKGQRNKVIEEFREHFIDALTECPEADRERVALKLIEEFGNPDELGRQLKLSLNTGLRGRQKLFFHAGQLLAGGVLVFIVCLVWSFLEPPGTGIDYAAEFNFLTHPKTEYGQNAAPEYLKALEAYVPPSEDLAGLLDDPARPLTPDREKEMLAWLDQNKWSSQMFLVATGKPCFWLPCPGNETLNVPLVHLSLHRALAKLMYVRMWKIDLKDPKALLRDLQAVYIQSRHLRSPSASILEQLTGIDLQRLADQNLCRLLRTNQIAPDRLADVASMLDGIFPTAYPLLNLQAERMMSLNVVQGLFTRQGLGGGHICPREATQWLKSRPQPVKDRDNENSLVFTIDLLLTHPRREDTVEIINEYYNLLEKFNALSPYERSKSGHQEIDNFLRRNGDNFVIRYFLPGLEKAGEEAFRARAEFDMVRTTVALERYRHKTGTYPNTLEVLVPVWLKSLPPDPYRNGPLLYRRQGNVYTLSSAGISDNPILITAQH